MLKLLAPLFCPITSLLSFLPAHVILRKASVIIILTVVRIVLLLINRTTILINADDAAAPLVYITIVLIVRTRTIVLT